MLAIFRAQTVQGTEVKHFVFIWLDSGIVFFPLVSCVVEALVLPLMLLSDKVMNINLFIRPQSGVYLFKVLRLASSSLLSQSCRCDRITRPSNIQYGLLFTDVTRHKSWCRPSPWQPNTSLRNTFIARQLRKWFFASQSKRERIERVAEIRGRLGLLKHSCSDTWWRRRRKGVLFEWEEVHTVETSLYRSAQKKKWATRERPIGCCCQSTAVPFSYIFPHH